MTPRARKPSSSSSEDSSSDDCPSPPKKNILQVKKPVTPSTIVFSSEDSDEDVKPKMKKSAAVKQVSGQAAVKMDQDREFSKLRQELLIVARGLPQPFKPNALEKKFGKRIPFEKFGFSSLITFLLKHPDLVILRRKRVYFVVRTPEVEEQLKREAEELRQRLLTVARFITPPFSYSTLMGAYCCNYREAFRVNRFGYKNLTEFVAGIPEMEVIDAKKGLYRVIGWNGPPEDPCLLRHGAKYEALQDEVYKAALRLESPFSCYELSTANGNRRFPYTEYGFFKLSEFLMEHPRFGKLDNGEEKCFFLKKPEPTVPPQISRKRVLEESDENAPVAVKKKRPEEIKEESSSGGSSSDESVVKVQKQAKKITRDNRLDTKRQVKAPAKGKKAESSADDSSESDEASLPLKKATPTSRLGGKKQAKGQKALAKGKESSTDSTDSDSPPVSQKAETTVKIKKEEPSADSSGSQVKSEVSSLNGSASNMPNVAPQVGWNDNYAPPQGGFFPPQFNQFNPMAYPPQMMSYQMQSMPVPPTKNELFG